MIDGVKCFLEIHKDSADNFGFMKKFRYYINQMN